MAERRHPHSNIQAEAAVVSALILSPELIGEVRDAVQPEDFWLASHRAVFEALLQLDERAGRIDVVTVAHQLQADGQLQKLGGTPFLAGLIDATPSVANVLEHARIVHRLADLRAMRGTLQRLAAEAEAPETLAGIPSFLERCESEVFAVAQDGFERDTAGTLREVMTDAGEQLSPTAEHRPRGASTGLDQLDQLTMGLLPGELWYVAARPGQGKTALAVGMARHVAGSSGFGIVFSLEMSRAELGERLISAESGIGLRNLQRRELSADQWGQVTTALDELGSLPMLIDDSSQLSPSRLRSRLRRHVSRLRSEHAGGRLGVVVVDYVQLMSGEPSWRGINRAEELERISRALKLLAKEFGVPVLALSQLNRGQRDRTDKRPTLYDLRGSGALEQDADKVLFIHRDELEGQERGEAELVLAKGRNAATGHVAVRWEPWCVRFRNEEQAGFDYYK